MQEDFRKAWTNTQAILTVIFSFKKFLKGGQTRVTVTILTTLKKMETAVKNI